MFIFTLIEDPLYGITWIGIVMFSICLHEYAHAAMALKCGDDTAASQGHLSLNPAVQMGGISILFLFLLGITWGAVPVNENRMRHRLHPALVAFAGPLANLVLCGLFAMALAVVESMAQDLQDVAFFFRVGSLVNGALFCLNMLPVPPLDGWSVLAGFVPSMKQLTPQLVQNISFILILILFLGAFRFVWMGGQLISSIFIGLSLNFIQLLF